MRFGGFGRCQDNLQVSISLLSPHSIICPSTVSTNFQSHDFDVFDDLDKTTTSSTLQNDFIPILNRNNPRDIHVLFCRENIVGHGKMLKVMSFKNSEIDAGLKTTDALGLK